MLSASHIKPVRYIFYLRLTRITFAFILYLYAEHVTLRQSSAHTGKQLVNIVIGFLLPTCMYASIIQLEVIEMASVESQIKVEMHNVLMNKNTSNSLFLHLLVGE